jgi:hypothetical protein
MRQAGPCIALHGLGATCSAVVTAARRPRLAFRSAVMAIGMLAQPAAAADYPLSCRADVAPATVVTIGGRDTTQAIITGRHLPSDAQRHCQRSLSDDDRKPSPAAIRSCVERLMVDEGRAEYRSEANCRTGSIRLSGPGGSKTYQLPIRTTCADNGATAAILFRMLCPTYRGRVETEAGSDDAAAQQPPQAPTSGRTQHGTSIACDRGSIECKAERSLVTCNFEQAGILADRLAAGRRTPPPLKGCGILEPGQALEVEATTHPRVMYAKEGTRHIGYVPIDVEVGRLGSGRFPVSLHGVWLSSPAQCRKYQRSGRSYDDDDFLAIGPSELRAHESSARILSITEPYPGTWQVDLHYSGDGTEWLGHVMLHRHRDTLAWREGGHVTDRFLCASGSGGGRLR